MSLVYSARGGFALWTGAALGASLALHAAVPMLLADQLHNPSPEITRQEAGVRGAILFDLSDVISAPSDMGLDSAEVAEAQEAPTITNSPHAIDPAQSADQPILQQVPYEIADDTLKFDIAAPDSAAETDRKATEIAEEFDEEKTEQDTSVAADDAQASDAAVSGLDADQQADRAQAASEGLTAEQLAEVSDWQKSIVLRIAKAKTYPQRARQKGIEGEVRIKFEIDRYGVIVSRSVDTSSGWPILDQAALDVMDEIGKMPTPPGHMTGDRFTMVIPFNFRIKT